MASFHLHYNIINRTCVWKDKERRLKNANESDISLSSLNFCLDFAFVKTASINSIYRLWSRMITMSSGAHVKAKSYGWSRLSSSRCQGNLRVAKDNQTNPQRQQWMQLLISLALTSLIKQEIRIIEFFCLSLAVVQTTCFPFVDDWHRLHWLLVSGVVKRTHSVRDAAELMPIKMLAAESIAETIFICFDGGGGGSNRIY